MLPQSISAFLLYTFLLLTTNIRADPERAKFGEEFCYDDDEDCGPSHWQGVCADNAVHQSPIDITTNAYVPNPPRILMAFRDYSTEQYGFTILNNGHSVQLKVLPDKRTLRPTITYGVWGEYVFEQAHLHWGENSLVGSEHTVNGSSTSMEIHLVHYSSRYANFEDALESNDPSALSVVGVLVELSPTPNPELDNIVQALRYVTPASQFGVSVGVAASFKLDYLLPPVRDFFSYDGSLTTPPCYEEVKWTFLLHPIRISESQLAPFRVIASHAGRPLTKNYRPIQPLGDRKVEFFQAN